MNKAEAIEMIRGCELVGKNYGAAKYNEGLDHAICILKDNAIQPTTEEAWEVIKKEYELPINFLDLWNKSGDHRGIFNSIEFELSKKDDDRTAEQFIFDYLEIYKNADDIKGGLEQLMKFEQLDEKSRIIVNMDIETLIEHLAINGLDKPQKVVIPKLVADWIKFCKKNAELSACLIGSYDTGNTTISIDDFDEFADWIGESDNESLLARAWLDGYEVEKEKLFEVSFGDVGFLYKDRHGYLSIGSLPRVDLDKYQIYFTESEIKSIDERYFAFTVEVEDAE